MNQEASTRKIILTMLKTKGSLSVSEMAKQLSITEMAVRRHLNTLDRDKLITSELVRKSMGRPTHIYSLTKKADDLFPKNYHKLTLDILDELISEFGNDAVDKLFEGRENKLFIKYDQRMNGKTLETKVEELVEIQKETGYMAECDLDEQGNFVLMEYNCPIAQVADQYQQACDCELSLFKKLLETDVERTECIAKGGNKCTYVVQNNEN
ncbi:helix-turn-helix transcriptional regulator [Chengkuizengella axinellae]|uniref:Transcriptional regulator n=1 Tax=Chengkuizengella axinellae TaxID=3064388 RepID=A0ABT9J282_9BACL|nr:metalloregulator ArsR/SmtB family transcription factor [Chengkuizengella sp. 2205SS18-9]MDP5275724.1 transcriptional regulator [Chengkuizengella sp. 2205SS18-9]